MDRPPPSLDKAGAEQDRIAREKDTASINEGVYKGDKIRIDDASDPYHGEEEFEVRYALRKLYHNKCAYCECEEFKPDVEHYRPKKRVTGAQRNNHGYYWLCYEWSNLLPACSACNSRSGKWNKFPVLGRRVSRPPFSSNGFLDFPKCRADREYLLSERPGILHPEVDEPENYFELKWNGQLSPLDGNSGRGFLTLKTCDLNRGNLLFARKAIIDDIIRGLKSAFVLFRNGDIPTADNLRAALQIKLSEIKDKADASQPYSFVAFFIWRHFPVFVEQNFRDLAPEEAELLVYTFREVL